MRDMDNTHLLGGNHVCNRDISPMTQAEREASKQREIANAKEEEKRWS